MKFSIRLLLPIILATLIISEPDPNFYIFLAFGDAYMEGGAHIEQGDIDDVSDRFLMMPAIETHKFNRFFGNWYKAFPPLCRPWTILSALDFFGRSLTKSLPENIKVGVINVAISNSSIVIFDEDEVEQYLSSTTANIRDVAQNYYGGHPYKALMDAAKKAQEYGVIKGILVHQGIADNGDIAWPYRLKLIYQRMLQELNLNGDDVPLLVGELHRKEQNGLYYAHNEIIANVPSIIPNSFIASSELDIQSDNRTFINREVYKAIGKRFAESYLTFLGMEFYDPDPNFYIFLAFGDANMEGTVSIEQADIDDVSDRFLMMPVVNMVKFNRISGEWYKATPPLCREYTHISSLDFFGRALIKNLPKNIKVGVINVAVSGSAIDIFDEDKVEQYLNSAQNYVKDSAENNYNGHPYKVLMDAAKKAQKYGVIKGILVHQGDSDNGEYGWPQKLKLIYERMLNELDLKIYNVPLLVGELTREEQKGYSYAHNDIIAKLSLICSNVFIGSSEVDIESEDSEVIKREVYKEIGKRLAKSYINSLGMEFIDPDA